MAGAPGAASFEVTVLVVLICTPIARPVTLTENVHDAPAARVPPDRLMLFDPAVAVIVPPHEPVRPFGVDTISPDGDVSVTERPVNVVIWLGFVSVKLRAVLLGPSN